jgi:hypothetical protein
MTIPPKTLWSRLLACESVRLKNDQGDFVAVISGSEARTLAGHGLIEGVVSRPGGPVRFVRYLNARAKTVDDAMFRIGKAAPEVYESHSTAFCRDNLRVYHEAVCQPIIRRDFSGDDHPVVDGETKDVISHVYAFALLRRSDGRSNHMAELQRTRALTAPLAGAVVER